MIEDKYTVLKTWEEIDKVYPHFINEDNLCCEEIYIKEDKFYMSSEYRNVLGKKVKLSIQSQEPIAHTTYWTDREGGYTISEFMIKRDTTYELDPECFI